MQRTVQLWRFMDASDQPLPPIPAAKLHRFLVEQDRQRVAMSCEGSQRYVTHLSPVVGTEPHVILSHIRQDNLPSERRDGRIVPLNRDVNELAEGSHFLFLDRNLVAFIGSGFSPRPSRLAEWLRIRAGYDVWLQPVLRQDVGAILDQLRKVTSVELKISADEARMLDLSDFFEGDSDPLGALLTAQQAQQGGIITVGWSIGQGGDADQGWFRRLVERLRGADLERFRSVRAKVYVDNSDDSVPIDFLHDKVVATVPVEQANGRQRLLDPPVALDAMRQAWTQFDEVHHVRDIVDPLVGDPLGVPDALIPVTRRDND